MLTKIILIFLQFNLINSFNFPKIISSIIISSSLLNNNIIPELILPDISSSEIDLHKFEKHSVINEDNLGVQADKLGFLRSVSVVDGDLQTIKNEDTNVKYSNIKIENNNIYFYGPITSESCKELCDILILLDTNAKIFSVNLGIESPPINLHIQSEGGSLMNTFYVADLINNLDTPVYTYVDGYVASAGSLISVMGKKRFMTKNSFIMIHQLSSSLGEAKFNDLDDNMDNLNKFMDTIKNIYLEKTKIPINNLNNILEHDLWMDSKECLDFGVVDQII